MLRRKLRAAKKSLGLWLKRKRLSRMRSELEQLKRQIPAMEKAARRAEREAALYRDPASGRENDRRAYRESLQGMRERMQQLRQEIPRLEREIG